MPKSDEPSERSSITAWAVIQRLCETVSIYDGPAEFRRGFEKLPCAVGHLFAVSWCDSEICNGGFHQFFSNSTGILAPEAIAGFREIGLDDCASLAAAAIGKFSAPYPRDRATRRAALRAMERTGSKREEWDPFHELDEKYYATKRRLAFDEILDNYARQTLPR